jgi:hypothetical protein
VDKICKVLIGLLLAYMGVYVRDSFLINRAARELHPEIPFPELKEFWKAGYVAVFFSVTKYLMKSFFVAMVKPWCKDQDDPEML